MFLTHMTDAASWIWNLWAEGRRHPVLDFYFYSVMWSFLIMFFNDMIMSETAYPWEFRMLNILYTMFIPIFNVMFAILGVYSMLLKINGKWEEHKYARNTRWADEHYARLAEEQAKNAPPAPAVPKWDYPYEEPSEGFDPITGAYWDPIAKCWADPELVDEAIHRKFKGPFRNFKKRGE